MKNIIVVILLFTSSLFAYDQSSVQLIQISDSNNEYVTGAKVELIGTGKVFYTNSKGECYIPVQLFKQCQSIEINCISYKTVQYKNFELSSKVILEFR